MLIGIKYQLRKQIYRTFMYVNSSLLLDKLQFSTIESGGD